MVVGVFVAVVLDGRMNMTPDGSAMFLVGPSSPILHAEVGFHVAELCRRWRFPPHVSAPGGRPKAIVVVVTVAFAKNVGAIIQS